MSAGTSFVKQVRTSVILVVSLSRDSLLCKNFTLFGINSLISGLLQYTYTSSILSISRSVESIYEQSGLPLVNLFVFF